MTEELVRDLLSEQAREVPVDGDLLAAVGRRRRARRQDRLRAAGSGLAVVLVLTVIGGVVALARSGSGPHGGSYAGPERSVAAPVGYPAGTRPVTWAGIQLDVPAAWTTAESDPHRCAPQDLKAGGEVDYPGTDASELFACQEAAHPVRERLELGTDYSLYPDADADVTPGGVAATFAGAPALENQTEVHGQVVTEYSPDATHAIFTLTTDTAAQAAAIVRTAHVVGEDENGCAIAQPDGAPVVGTGGAGAVLTSTPVGGVACSYRAGRLQSGVTLDAADTAALGGALGRLPAAYTAAQQRALPSAPNPTPGTTVVLTLRNAVGAAQQVTVEYAPGTIGVAGAHHAALTEELAGDLTSVLPTGLVSAYGQGILPTGCSTCAAAQAPAPTRPVTYRGITLNVPATLTDIGSSPCPPDGGYIRTVSSTASAGAAACPAPQATRSPPVPAPPVPGPYADITLTDDRYGAAASGGSVLVAGLPAVQRVVFSAGQDSTFATVTVTVKATHAQIVIDGHDALAILATARPAGGAS